MALPALTAKRTPFPGCEVPPLFPSYLFLRAHIQQQAETLLSTAQSVAAVTPLPSTVVNDSNFLDSPFRYHLFPTAYGIIFIVGLFANIYVLFVLRCLREANAMGEIRIYMTNLTIADLLFVCALPFWIGYYSRQGTWVYKDFLCRLTGSFFFINTYCSILFLAAISANRYWAVTKPLDAASSDHRCRGIAVSAVIWFFTVSLSIPFLIKPGTNQDGNITRCFEAYQDGPDSSKRIVALTHFLIIGMFFVVFALVVVFNLLIARSLFSQSIPLSEFKSGTVLSRKSNMTISSSRKPTGVKRRAVQMLMAVVGVFVLCFLPHHLVQGFWTLATLQIQEGWGHVDWSGETVQALNDMHQVTLFLMGLNCILDPVVYCFATRKFRRFIVAHLKRMTKGEGCSYTVTSQISLDSRQHSQKLPDELPQPTL
nr:platelet-activating factor receptor-like [Nerophis lumbriciformis]